MSESQTPPAGAIGWLDLTVPDADAIRDFYAAVVGWRPEPVAMGDYSDYNMTGPTDDTPRAGVCFARGANAHLPPHWIPYFVVTDLDAGVREATARGGTLLSDVKAMGGGARYVAFQDPAGAVAAIYQPA
jgi:predicted enzyme related to lactoylglutathione lyase